MFCSITPTICAICPTSAFSVIQTLEKEGYRHIFEINGRTPNRFEVPHHRITDAAPGLVSGPAPRPTGPGHGRGVGALTPHHPYSSQGRFRVRHLAFLSGDSPKTPNPNEIRGQSRTGTEGRTGAVPV